ncbi:MAG: M15 family metallopeptidase [Candidatus Gracilibacteria bacterium]|jgi:D-alanyl-D-alanine dipeptidase
MTLIEYTSVRIRENRDPLVNLAVFNFILEPKYFQKGLAEDSKMFIRREVGSKLERIQEKLKGYRFKIWDGHRSRVVQNNIYKKYWEELAKRNPGWNEKMLKLETGKFVSPANNPERIPPHATGGSIDLTLVDKEGNELKMGTEFDAFGPNANPFADISPEVTENRKILREAMLEEDFTMDKDEWWHFDYGNQSWALNKGRPFAIYGEV